jgi:hypothetical protein
MAEAGAIVSGVSSIVGVIAASQVAAALLTAAEVTAVTGGAALALGFGIPIVGAVIGLALGDALLGKRDEKRSVMNYLASAACSLLGFSLGSTILGGAAFASSAGLVTEEAIKQTVATNVIAPSIQQMMAITSAGALAGGALGAVGGAAIGNKIAK